MKELATRHLIDKKEELTSKLTKKVSRVEETVIKKDLQEIIDEINNRSISAIEFEKEHSNFTY